MVGKKEKNRQDNDQKKRKGRWVRGRRWGREVGVRVQEVRWSRFRERREREDGEGEKIRRGSWWEDSSREDDRNLENEEKEKIGKGEKRKRGSWGENSRRKMIEIWRMKRKRWGRRWRAVGGEDLRREMIKIRRTKRKRKSWRRGEN